MLSKRKLKLMQLEQKEDNKARIQIGVQNSGTNVNSSYLLMSINYANHLIIAMNKKIVDHYFIMMMKVWRYFLTSCSHIC